MKFRIVAIYIECLCIRKVILLRHVVGIYKNYDVLVGNDMGGQIAFGYGHGKIIGFSTGNCTFRGYANGVDNVLWDHFGEFDKWSRCNKIPKTTTNEEIIDILINNKNE